MKNKGGKKTDQKKKAPEPQKKKQEDPKKKQQEKEKGSDIKMTKTVNFSKTNKLGDTLKKSAFNETQKVKTVSPTPKKKPKEALEGKKLGEGASGECYLIKTAEGEEEVVKLINLKDATNEEIQKAEVEANILKQLDHPNIIKFKDCKIEDKMMKLYTEYAQNGDLLKKINERKEKLEYFTEDEIKNYLYQICYALSYAHSKKVIHRDIKPSNIFLDINNNIKVGDFGVSKISTNNSLSKTLTVHGTVSYMSPEMHDGEDYDYKTDVWSLGVTLLELFTLQPPKQNQILKKSLKNEEFDIPSIYSPSIRYILKMSLKYEKENRASVDDIIRLLKESEKDNLINKNINNMNSNNNNNENPFLFQDNNNPNNPLNNNNNNNNNSSNGNNLLFRENVEYNYGTYTGQFNQEGKWEGKGLLKFANGNIYEGEFKGGLPNGKGNFKFANGNIYEGDYKNGLFDGKGIFKWNDGDIYEGEYKENKRCGKGIMKYANGETYEGNFKDNEKNGYGIFKFANGNIYEGNWKNNKQNGKGIVKFVSGNIYDGEWEDEMFNGKGIYKYSNGNIYEGEWRNNKKHGKGIMKWNDGTIYDGEWKNGLFNGKGKYTFASGNIYIGEYKDDKRNGKGVMKSPNGDIYDGEFKDDNIHGKGIMKYASGVTTEQEWDNGKLISEKKV